MGKGGGKAHTPVEAKDNLKSTQMMSVIDAIGEGPIEGPVKGLQSILVNKTPLTDTDGNPRDTRCDRGLARRGAGADTTGRL
ncbi:phage tail fiber /phage host specificity protein J [Escherichia coli DEC8B]|nr:phage tail fiber /phage host specificity protein J [Escherichia coli DEC8B]